MDDSAKRQSNLSNRSFCADQADEEATAAMHGAARRWGFNCGIVYVRKIWSLGNNAEPVLHMDLRFEMPWSALTVEQRDEIMRQQEHAKCRKCGNVFIPEPIRVQEKAK